MTDDRRFWRILLLIVLAALALRVGYVLLAKRHEPALGDQIYYVAQANTLARGDGFTDPRDGSQTAEHPPLTALALTPTAWVAEQLRRGRRPPARRMRLTMTVFGAARGAGDRPARARASPATAPGCSRPRSPRCTPTSGSTTAW